MATPRDAPVRVQSGDLLRTYANNRPIVYRADRVDPRARLVIGVMLDDDGDVITGFIMSFEAWKNAAKHSET